MPAELRGHTAEPVEDQHAAGLQEEQARDDAQQEERDLLEQFHGTDSWVEGDSMGVLASRRLGHARIGSRSMGRTDPPRTRSQLAEQAQALAALHRSGRPLVLPNAWDAGSARAVEAAGFSAVATTSAGVARSLGYEDHERAPVEEMLAAAARIARAVSVPVTVDFEAGYGLAPAVMIERLLEAGAVGCNFEDTDHAQGGLVAMEAQAERIAALRASAERSGVPFVLNARVDVFLHEFPDEEARLDEGIRPPSPIARRAPAASTRS